MSNRYKNYALAMAPVAAILLTLGCSSSKHSASTNANLAGLKVTGGIAAMTPGFSATSTTYTLPTVYGGDPGSIVVTPATDDEKATITVNGHDVASFAASSPIPLVTGDNTITVIVTAEDGKTTMTYTIKCKVLAKNTSVTVMDSSNGVPVPGALITVADASGKVLQSGIATDAKGTTLIGLDGTSKYTLTAIGVGTAQSKVQEFDSSRETSATFFCHPLGMVAFPALAPTFTDLAYTPDGTTWTTIEGNAVSDTKANLHYLGVSALGSSNVASTAWSGFGMGLNIDQTAWSWSYIQPIAIEEEGVPVTAGATTMWRSTVDFNIASMTAHKADSTHFLDLVAYDVANNRTEKKLYVNITDGAADTTQDDLSALTPSGVVAQFITHSVTRSIFAADKAPFTREPDIFYTLLKANKAVAKITGAEIERSSDGVNWLKVGTQIYGTPTAANSLAYTVNSTTIQTGVQYFFRVRCFNGNTTTNGGYSQYSPTVACTFLPPFDLNLAVPANGTVSYSLKPALGFNLSDASLWDPTVSDYFYFFLYIREKTGSSSYSQAYRYNFLLGRFEILSGTWGDASALVSIDSAHQNVAIAAPPYYFQPGVSYEWSIFGTKGTTSVSTSDSANFRKYTYPYNDPASTSYGVALTRNSTYEEGYGAVNGFFSLTIDPNAK